MTEPTQPVLSHVHASAEDLGQGGKALARIHKIA